jgi:P pilus assembly chaperone PapD
MCAFFRYSAGGLAALLTTAYVAASAESGISAFRAAVIEPAPAAETVVNRTNKADREVIIRNAVGTVTQRTPVTPAQKKPATATKDSKILEGCDPAFSPLTGSAKSNFANRCLV